MTFRLITGPRNYFRCADKDPISRPLPRHCFDLTFGSHESRFNQRRRCISLPKPPTHMVPVMRRHARRRDGLQPPLQPPASTLLHPKKPLHVFHTTFSSTNSIL
ncbi:hypothetical protein TcasGA2_TC008436 [Tribolium castaneum]|uniref:Uncharacterized protein n=1 Tax=Tribolium castaneum TaxID=7070 RepID=D2A200_TRICA|nr:hypothetical protein TcasGA2_TC008436 [Tribolium castaneum]